MKLAFTTLGCPEWNMDTIIAKAVEYGYDGVDFRGYMGKIDIYELPEFSTGAEATAKRFRDAGLEVTCFSSSITLYCETAEALEKNLNELRQYLKLCRIFGASYIRVFGGRIGEADRNRAIEAAAKNLAAMADISKEYGVTILLETHDDWTDSQYVRAVMEKAAAPRAAVLWDVHHPYRTLGEAPAKTWETLGRWIENTHWKDSYSKEGEQNGHQLCLLGAGDIPLQEIYGILKKNGYTGYFTLEWEKKWHPEIEEPEIAFPQYAGYMKKL